MIKRIPFLFTILLFFNHFLFFLLLLRTFCCQYVLIVPYSFSNVSLFTSFENGFVQTFVFCGQDIFPKEKATANRRGFFFGYFLYY